MHCVLVFLVATVFLHADAGRCGSECTDPDSGHVYPGDMVWTSSKTCKLYGCKKNSTSGEYELTIEGTCPVYKLKEECSLTPQDLSQNYPDCCPQPKCP